MYNIYNVFNNFFLTKKYIFKKQVPTVLKIEKFLLKNINTDNFKAFK